MAELSLFYDAVLQDDGTYDRAYTSADWAKYFENIFRNGVMMSVGEALRVTAADSVGMRVVVKAGSASLKGYQYIRDSIELMYNNPDTLGGITKEVYPYIADKYNTTPSRVERAIRHAIEVSWNRGDYDLMEEIFGHSVDFDRAKPTNSEFLATVADKIHLDGNKVR